MEVVPVVSETVKLCAAGVAPPDTPENVNVVGLRPMAGTGAPTETVTEAEPDPPGPVQESVYVVVAERLPVLCDPVVPVHDPGVTVQEVELEDVQDMLAVPWYGTEHEELPLQRIEAVTAGLETL